MKRFILILSFFIIVACNQNQSTGANMDNSEESFPIMKNASYDLSDEEIKTYSQKALQGNNKAAIKVSNYYEYIENDTYESVKWLELAAKNGDIHSMRNVSVFYSILKRYPEALYWAEKYKEFEPEKAEELINDLKSELNE